MIDGFIIKCKNCNNEMELVDGANSKDRINSGYSFYTIQSTYLNIICNCENEVYIEED